MFTTPKIEISIRRRLHFATPLKIPIAVEISSPEYINEQEKQVRLRQLPLQQTLDLWIAILSRPQDRFVIGGYCQYPVVHFGACIACASMI